MHKQTKLSKCYNPMFLKKYLQLVEPIARELGYTLNLIDKKIIQMEKTVGMIIYKAEYSLKSHKIMVVVNSAQLGIYLTKDYLQQLARKEENEFAGALIANLVSKLEN